MKYFVIYSDRSGLSLEQFYANNKELSDIQIFPVKVNSDSYPLIKQGMLSRNIITDQNQYHEETLAYCEAHIALWNLAQKEQTDITVFESHAITHSDFLFHQNNILNKKNDYDLIILGYNLSWNMCLEVMPGLPNVIYTFPGNKFETTYIPNNLLIDIPTYHANPIHPQIFKALSFASMGCYSLSHKGASTLLDRALPIGNDTAPSYLEQLYGTNFYVTNKVEARENISLDIEVNRHIHDLKTYITVPLLAVLPG